MKAFNNALNRENFEEVEKFLNENQNNKSIKNNHKNVAMFNRTLCLLSTGLFHKGEYRKSVRYLRGIIKEGLNFHLYQFNA